MTEPQSVVLARLADEFNLLSQHLARVSSILAQIGTPQVGTSEDPRPAAPPSYAFAPPPPPPPPAYFQPAYFPPVNQPVAAEERGQGWIGKALAVAGVIVTLVGVVLLLVLAAQAGLLRPEVRVAGGVALSAALVTVAARLQSRPGGRVGAIALGATGIAAGYLNVIAVSTIYEWIPAPVALIIAALVGGAGLGLARSWNSQHLAVLVLVPLAVLAPVITGGVTILLVGFMLALSAAALPAQLGRDWIWMHAARIAAVTLLLLSVLTNAQFGGTENPWLLGSACGLAALLSIVSALVLLPSVSNRPAVALVSAAGLVPVLVMKGAVDQWFAALLAAALAAMLLSLSILGGRLPGGDRVVTQIWAVLSAAAALVAVTVGFDGVVATPVLLAMALAVAIAGHRGAVSSWGVARWVVTRWIAVGLGGVGALMYLDQTPPAVLATATVVPVGVAISTLVSSMLAVGWAAVVARSWVGSQTDARVLWVGAGAVMVYASTAFAVTIGVLIGGVGGGFLAGHMAATICWIALAASLFGYALRVRRDVQAAPIAGGLTLTAAAMAKLFLFDLGTLDGIFRVIAFIVVGVILLAMGAGYARNLAVQADRERPQVQIP